MIAMHTGKTHPALSKALLGFLFLMLFPAPGAFAQSDIHIYFDRQFYTSGDEVGVLWRPFKVAIDSQNRIIVIKRTHENDEGENAVHVCDDSGHCSAFGKRGSEVGQFIGIGGVAVDGNDRILISDSSYHRIQICNDLGECSAFGGYSGVLTTQSTENTKTQAETGKFYEPAGVAVDNQDRIIVADSFNHRIQVCNHEGTCTAFGSEGESVGEFGRPRGLTVDSQGRIIVADTRNDRIQVCDYEGSCSAFGETGTNPGQFDVPVDVATDSEGNIFVADYGNNRVQVCSYDGECDAFGSLGSDAGEFDWPHGIALDSKNRIIVADEKNGRIQLFRTDGPFPINAGLNDAWYNPDTSGQGFFITVFPGLGYVSMAWFTYDTELPHIDAVANLGDPGHRWLTAVGPIEGNQALLDIELTSGGIFDTATEITHTDPPGSDGTILLTFDHCNSGTVEYDIPSINRQGTVPVQRVASDNITLCEALNND